jgi:hypothetical protein
MSKIREPVSELLFPPFVLLLKIVDMLIEESNKENANFATLEELKEAVKEVVIEYCREAWSEGRMPLYTFKFQWESPELERDLSVLFDGDFISSASKITLTERGKCFLERYKDIVYLDQYEERIKKAIDQVISKINKEKRES